MTRSGWEFHLAITQESLGRQIRMNQFLVCKNGGINHPTWWTTRQVPFVVFFLSYAMLFGEQHKSPASPNGVSTSTANGKWICHSWKCQRLATPSHTCPHLSPSLLTARARSRARWTERHQSEPNIFWKCSHSSTTTFTWALFHRLCLAWPNDVVFLIACVRNILRSHSGVICCPLGIKWFQCCQGGRIPITCKSQY